MKLYMGTLLITVLMVIPAVVPAQGGDGPNVVQIILLDYDGDEAALADAFSERQSIYAKINPEASMRLMYDEIHGGAVGRYRIHVGYPSAKYFGEAQGREAASEEWQAAGAGLSTTRTYEGLSREVLPPVTAPAVSAGSPGVVHVILFDYNGDEADLVEGVKETQAIFAKINPEASMRLLYDEIHGGAVGRYRVHIYYPSIAYFGEAQGREASSEELKQSRQGRSAASTRTYEGLSRVVVPING